MKVLVFLAAVVLAGCTRGPGPAGEVPSVQPSVSKIESAPATGSKEFRNICEQKVSPAMANLPGGTVAKALVIRQGQPAVCQVRFQSGTEVQEALFFVGEKLEPKLIHKTAVHPIAECGMTAQEIKAETVNLKVSGSPREVVAIETLTTKVGCADSEERVGSQVMFFDLTTQKMSNSIKGSDADSGMVARYDWVRCTGASVCERIHLDRRDPRKNLKPLQFVINWDGDLRIRESGF